MNDKFIYRIIFRFLFRSQSVGVLPWLTLFALASVAVGVATLIIVLSVMNGFSTTLQQQLVGIYSPIRIYPDHPGRIDLDKVRGTIEKDQQITQIIGVIDGDVLFRSEHERYQGGRVISFSSWKSQRFPGVSSPEDGVVLGQSLARDLWLVPGDTLLVIRPSAQQTPFGVLPGGMKIRVDQVVRTGYQPVDQYLAIIGWNRGRNLFDIPPNRADHIEVWLKDRFASQEIKQRLKKQLGPGFVFVTWQEANPSLFEALKLERTVTFIVLGLIVLVATINILSMLVLSILQRRKQIAMMMAMGATPNRILTLFLMAGMLITVLGLGSGFGLGLGGCYMLDNIFTIDLPPVYPMSQLPVDIDSLHLVTIGVVTLLLGFISSFYPAWAASRIDPAEVLRYG